MVAILAEMKLNIVGTDALGDVERQPPWHGIVALAVQQANWRGDGNRPAEQQLRRRIGDQRR
jgi:hypothetical protein